MKYILPLFVFCICVSSRVAYSDDVSAADLAECERLQVLINETTDADVAALRAEFDDKGCPALIDGNAATDTLDDVKCLDGTEPNANGCCNDEVYTDMGDAGFNCCPANGGDCFPPLF
ncbi:MAG: hypothetical protein IJ560_02665 [Alphaproteobacteria bacterium]|nr:hypothetical protein [Alphaproteobacteria bacterium]